MRSHRWAVAALVAVMVLVCSGCAHAPVVTAPNAGWHPMKVPGVIAAMPGPSEDAEGKQLIERWRMVVVTDGWVVQLYVSIHAFGNFSVGQRVVLWVLRSDDGQIQVGYIQGASSHLPNQERAKAL